MNCRKKSKKKKKKSRNIYVPINHDNKCLMKVDNESLFFSKNFRKYVTYVP